MFISGHVFKCKAPGAYAPSAEPITSSKACQECISINLHFLELRASSTIREINLN